MILLVATALAEPLPGAVFEHDPTTLASQGVFDGPLGLLDDPARLNAEVDQGFAVGAPEATAPSPTAVGALWREDWTLVLGAQARGERSQVETEGPRERFDATDHALRLGLGGSYALSGATFGGSLIAATDRRASTLTGDPLGPEPGANRDDGDVEEDGGAAARTLDLQLRFAAARAQGDVRPYGGLGLLYHRDAARLSYARTTPGAGGDPEAAEIEGVDVYGVYDSANVQAFGLEARGAVDQGGTLRDPRWRGYLGVRASLLAPALKEVRWSEGEDDGGYSLAGASGSELLGWVGMFRQLGDPPAGRLRVGALALVGRTATTFRNDRDGAGIAEGEDGVDPPDFVPDANEGRHEASETGLAVLVPVAGELRPSPAWTLRASVAPRLDLVQSTDDDEDGEGRAQSVGVSAAAALGMAWRSPGGVGAALTWTPTVGRSVAAAWDDPDRSAAISLGSAGLWLTWEPGA